MQHLVRGVRRFREHVFPARRELYQQLRDRQNPHSLFITCSDSRLDPELITQSSPGDIFVLRNAGNLVPPYGAGTGGEAATIEYAVAGLKVRNVVVCGHAHCGAMKALLDPGALEGLTQTSRWLRHAEATRQVVHHTYADMPAEEEKWLAMVEENVLTQLNHLKTHPSVAAALAAGGLSLYGWVFDFAHGEVRCFDPVTHQFLPLPDGDEVPMPVFPTGRGARANGRAGQGAAAARSDGVPGDDGTT